MAPDPSILSLSPRRGAPLAARRAGGIVPRTIRARVREIPSIIQMHDESAVRRIHPLKKAEELIGRGKGRPLSAPDVLDLPPDYAGLSLQYPNDEGRQRGGLLSLDRRRPCATPDLCR
jgi:hypothetical protein